MNLVVLGGNLVRDPELKYTPSGTAICEFTIANTKKFKQNDEWKEKTGFYNCLCWGKRGEVIAEYFAKGKPILVRGELEFQTWETQEGAKRSTVKVQVNDFEFVGGKQDSAAPLDHTEKKPDINDDEIPF